MLKKMDSILGNFRGCFSREAAFNWFIITIVGFCIRCDHEGLTSFIRWLALDPAYYYSLLHFFHASSWELDNLLNEWTKWVINHYPIIEFNGRPLLIGDGIKIAKEAKRMPAVKRLHQESNNNSKKEYINGHHFGFVGVLVGSLKKAFCLSLHGEVHDGVPELRPSEGLNGKRPTLITRMARLLVAKAKQIERLSYAVLDAYHAVGPSFLILKEAVNEKGEQLVHLITKAKRNTVAYIKVENGKQFTEENKIKLIELFSQPDLFSQAEVEISGKIRTISYLCIDLLWKPIKDILRFVLILDGAERYILMCSDLNLFPTKIIAIYNYRSKIEVMFRALKYVLGGFCYHFWSKFHPKLQGKKLDVKSMSTDSIRL